MAREKKKSLTKGEYRRHIFDRARGGHGVKGARGVYDDDAWIKRSFAEQYEQDNSKKGWWSFDSTDRAKFRASELEKVRKAFRDSLSQHHWAKHRDNVNRFGQLADAYMNQTDAQFETTMAQMGISKPEDRARWRKAMEESLSNAVDGTAMSQNWDDQKDLAYSRGTPAQQNADAGEQTDGKAGGKTGGTTGGTTGPGTVANGRVKAQQPGAAPGQARTQGGRSGEPTQSITADSMRRPWQRPGAGINMLNNAHVQKGSSADDHMNQALAGQAQVAALQARDAARRQVATSSLADAEAFELKQNELERIEQIGKDRRARQAAEREAAAQRRADKRFADRTLYNEADWKNLGRAEGNKADYSARKEGESDESWRARETAIKEHQGRMGSLLKRLDRMADTEDEANDFYQYDPNKQKNLARLRGLIVKKGADGNDVVRDDITDAQIEGANATLDAWEKGAAKRKSEIKSFSDMKQAEQVARLRNQYGPAFGDYTPEQLLDYDKRQRDSARVEILRGMQVAPGLTPETGQPAYQVRPGQDDLRPSAMAKFSQDWQKLLDTGFDPTTTFREKILGDPSKKEAYEAGLATLSKNDPDYADKADQLRRRFIVQQAMEQYGIGQEGGGEQGQVGRQIKPPVQTQPGADDPVGIDREFWGEPPAAQTTSRQRGEALAQNLPGKSILQPRLVADIENPIQPRQHQQTPGVQVFNSATDAIKARDAANAAAGIPLKKKRSDGGMLS